MCGVGDICSLLGPRKGGFGFVFSKGKGENKFVFFLTSTMCQALLGVITMRSVDFYFINNSN